MKLLHTLLTIAFSVLVFVGFAQQDPQWSNYFYNQSSYNAGAIGKDYKLQATGMYRDQWNGLVGAPRTGLLVVDSKIDAISGGIGGMFSYGEIGNEKNIVAKLGYAYHMDLGPGTLQLGLNGEYHHKTIEPYWVSTSTSSIAVQQINSDQTFDAGAGVLFHTNSLQIGLGATHLLGTAFDSLNYTLVPHYYAFGSYMYPLSPAINLEPSILTKTDGATTQLDVTLRTHINNLFYVGTSYRTSDAIIFMLGYQGNNFRIGYSFDYTISQIADYSNNSHELFVGFLLE